MNLALMHRQCPICNKKKGNCHFPTQLHLKPPCLDCKYAWKPADIKYNGTALKVTHGKTPIRLLGIRYNMWLDSTAQRTYVMDGITEMACFLRKNRDLSIENGLRLIDCTLSPPLAFSGPVIIWPEIEFRKLTAAFVRCNKEAWQLSPNTSTALFTFPKDLGGLQIKLPRAILCSATWGHLTRCCQFDDGTRQLAEITYKDALEKLGCLDMEDLQFEAEFLTWDQASQNSFTFACHLTSTIGIRVSWDPFNPDWIASAANTDLAQVMIDTQHLIRIQLNNEQKWATVVGIREEGKLVNMQTEHGETFLMKTEGQDMTSGYPTLREAIQRTSPTLVRLSQLTEPNRVYGLEEKRQGKRKIGWSQAIYSHPSSTSGIEEPPSLREMGRSPRRRIDGTQKWRTGLHGYTAKTDPGGLYHAKLNPPSQEREWNEIRLPRSKRGGQQNPKKRIQVDSAAPQTPGPPPCIRYKRY